jgi:hypothetical protein
MGPKTRFGYRGSKGALAAYASGARNALTGNEGLLHLPTAFGKHADYRDEYARALTTKRAYRKQQEASLEFHIEQKDTIYDRFKMMQERGDDFTWTVDNLVKDFDQRTRSTIYHEYGHHVHLTDARMGPEINEVLRRVKPRENGWADLVSQYSFENDKEYVAEAFALYMEGEKQHYRINPDLLNVFKKYDKKVNP